MDQINWSYVIGFTGCFLVNLSFFFQLYEIYVRKSAKDISWGFVALQMIVNILFFISGLISDTLVMIVTNGSLTVVLCLLILEKIYYDRYYQIPPEETSLI